MDANQKKAKLKENLSKAIALNVLSHSKEYTETLLPYLKKLAQVPYIDPSRFKTEEEFLYVLKSANARAGAYTELLMFMAQQEAIMKKIRDDIEKPPKSHGI